MSRTRRQSRSAIVNSRRHRRDLQRRASAGTQRVRMFKASRRADASGCIVVGVPTRCKTLRNAPCTRGICFTVSGFLTRSNVLVQEWRHRLRSLLCMPSEREMHKCVFGSDFIPYRSSSQSKAENIEGRSTCHKVCIRRITHLISGHQRFCDGTSCLLTAHHSQIAQWTVCFARRLGPTSRKSTL